MSAVPDPQGLRRSLEGNPQQGSPIVDEINRLSEMDLAPAEYYAEFLKRLLPMLTAHAGAVWGRTGQGPVQLLYQINMGQVGFEDSPANRKRHDELLREAFRQPRPMYLPPQSGPGEATSGELRPGNPTNYVILMAPVVVDGQVIGLVEVLQNANRPQTSVPVLLQFLIRMAGLAAAYTRNRQRLDMMGRQRLWTDLETFTRTIHASLNPTEVAYTIANEARRLVACDRISIALCRGRRPTVTAVSGADIVERRSSLVQRMRVLFQRVLSWDEKLVYTGTRDPSLPPGVLQALDAYLTESNSKLLVVLPLRDERDNTRRRPPRSALLMECFETSGPPEAMIGQVEVVGRHAASALYNAVEYRRIPMRWLWQPFGYIQEGLGGKGRLAGFVLLLALAALVVAMIRVPYPLKMDARGQLLPEERCWIYSPVEGQVIRFAEGVQPGKPVAVNQSLVLMYDVQLELNLVRLNSEIAGAEQDIGALAREQAAATTEVDRLHFGVEKKQKEYIRDRKLQERAALRERTHSDEARPGYFWLKAPVSGTLLNWDFHESLTNRYVKPSEPLLRLGNKDRRWEIQLKVPQKHIGQILGAFPSEDANAELDVDLLLASCPTRTFKGKLSRGQIAGEANPNRDDPADSEPVVLASVRLDGPDIAAADRLPPDLLVTGTEVHTRIRCGDRPLGYSLFHGVWEFFYEKVVFFFMRGR